MRPCLPSLLVRRALVLAALTAGGLTACSALPGPDDATSHADTGTPDGSASGSDAGSDASTAEPWQPVMCQASDTPLCEIFTQELPIPTHYNAATGKREFMASGDPALFTAGGLPDSYAMGGCYPTYKAGVMPGTDDYPADDYAGITIPDSEAKSWAIAQCVANGVPVRHVFPPRPDGTEVGQGPLSRGCAVQVVHAITAADSLYSVFLPPGWDPAAPAGTYPIVFNGHYDLHTNTFRETGPLMTKVVAHSGLDGRRGVIGVLWNGGGAYASRTMSPHSLDLMAQVIADVAARYHGNPQWVVTMGGSRGGVTALRMAANPSKKPYRVVATVAAVPPALIGDHAKLGGVTFPALIHAVGWTVGLKDAWRSGWTYPACAGRPELTGLSGWQAHLKILTGLSDPDVANAQESLLAPRYLDALQASGTQIFLSVGEHDFIVPYAHQVQLGLAFVQRGLPAQIEVLVRGGHDFVRTGLGGATPPTVLHEKLFADIVDAIADPALDLAGPVPTLVQKGVRYHRVDRQTGEAQVFAPATYPFAVDLPFYAVAGQSFPIVVVGAPGTQFTITPTFDATGVASATFTGVIPDKMTTTLWVDLPANQPVGSYTWSANITLPDASTKAIPSTATTTGAPCTTTVIASEPAISASEASSAAAPPVLSHHPNTNWGLSEY